MANRCGCGKRLPVGAIFFRLGMGVSPGARPSRSALARSRLPLPVLPGGSPGMEAGGELGQTIGFH